MPDEIQLPEGVVEELAIWHYCLTHEGGEKHGTPWVKASEEEKEKSRKQARYYLARWLPAIIAANRDRALLELVDRWAEAGGERDKLCPPIRETVDAIIAQEREKWEAETLSPYCTEGCHLGAAKTCGHPRQTWQEVAERNAKAAGERRGEGRADFLRAERAEAERDDIRIRADDRLERLDKAEERVEALHHELRQAKAQALAELREALGERLNFPWESSRTYKDGFQESLGQVESILASLDQEGSR